MKNIINIVFVGLVLLLISSVSYAQPSLLPSFPVGPSTPWPIDGGLSLIIGGGIAYMAKKGYDKRNK